MLATQNPREFEGTYPLPESQLDRFMLRIDMDYPERDAEIEVLERYGGGELSAPLVANAGASGSGAARCCPRRGCADPCRCGALRATCSISRAPRASTADLLLGLSTRGALALLRAARIAAGLRGADFVTPDDVKAVGVQVMAHRLVLTPEAVLEGRAMSTSCAAPRRHTGAALRSACICPNAPIF